MVFIICYWRRKKMICLVYIFMLINWFLGAYYLIISLKNWRKKLYLHLKVQMNHFIGVYLKLWINTRKDWINMKKYSSRMMVINFTGEMILKERQQKIGNGGEHVETVTIFLFYKNTLAYRPYSNINLCCWKSIFMFGLYQVDMQVSLV